MIELDAPRRLGEQLDALRSAGLATDHDTQLGALLRAVATTRPEGIYLTSGKIALPYVGWIADGMSMQTRMLLHLDSAPKTADDILRGWQQIDIRIGGHRQASAAFASDIAHHQLDIIVSDATPERIAAWSPLMADAGMLFALGTDAQLNTLAQDMASDYFVAAAGSTALALTRKGMQHRRSRSGRRRARRRTTGRSA